MINEIKRFFRFLFEEEMGRKIIFRILFGAGLIAALLFFNKLILIKWVEKEYFSTHWALSRLAFREGVNPYQDDITSLISNSFPDVFPSNSTDNFLFQLPIFQLFLFYPMTFIRDFDWALTIWLTINQLLIMVNMLLLFRIFSIGQPKIFLAACTGFSFLFFSNFQNLLQGNIAIIHLSLLLLSIYYYKKNKLVAAGILLGLTGIEPFHFIVAGGFFILLMFYERKKSAVFWTIISVALLTISGIIFHSSWVLQFARNILSERSFFPLISYSSALLRKWDLAIQGVLLVNTIPVFLLLWMFYEFLRTPKNTQMQKWWLLGLGFIMNSLILMRRDSYTEILFLPVYMFIITLWIKRSKGIFNWIVITISILLSTLLPLLNYLAVKVYDKSLLTGQLIYFWNISYLLIMLYWVRLWILKDYSEQETGF